MFDRLAAIERQYEELIARLGTAELQNNSTEYRKSAKTASEIEPVVTKFREYQGVVKDMTGAQELAAAGDPEMRELAQQELKTLTDRREALVAELKVLLIPKDPNDEKNVVIE